jgi:hypothetical protein
VTVLVPPYVIAGGAEPLLAAIREREPGIDFVHAADDDAMLEAAPGAEIVVTSRLPEHLLEAADEPDVLLEASDVLVIACPLTDETEGLIDTEAIAALDSDAVLVNIARGEIVVQDALVDALEAEELRGAALDVFEEEPLPADSPAVGPRRRADYAPRGRFDPALRGAGGGGLRRHPRAVRGR